MASIVLATLGQAVGAATGIPYAGQLGSMIGSNLGSRFGGARRQHYEGARLENLAVQTSTYGRMIPITFGTVRISGNVIWARPLKELATTTEVSSGGGKGGGGARQSSSSTTYSYYATLAVAICEGEITRVERVWADSKLLDLSQGTYRIYKGGETQLPDTLIESFQGIGATPAYRGLAYVVIEKFPLADFGNRIPNFTFEVTRKVADTDEQAAESLVKSIMLIPGSGEFVYDTQATFKVDGTDASGTFVQSGHQKILNQHTAAGKANVLVALDQLQETLPNLEWVGVVVNWFGTSMDIASCEIWPGVEYQTTGVTTPVDWQVAGLSRTSARQIGYDGGQIRYGGTPDDASILRLLTELRARGLKIFFYPQMLMDLPGKPWRGYVTGASSAVNGFFTATHGYNNFILHYANLTAGRVDAFAIGTELRDLTKVSSSAGVFPAVTHLASLAATVRTVMGSDTILTYAADWSEYHHTDGGWYHLDALWASPAIDVVGIDAYFPLSDAVQTGYDSNALEDGWTSGEGYDWYYTDPARTIKASLSPAYAWKNIDWWWRNSHTNPDSSVSAWVPESKPIWFTEYGFASVDGCANQPNVFVDGSTYDSALPRFSRGRIDFLAQRTAITATERKWQASDVVENKFLWTWDARPYPYWPDLLSVWADGNNWVTGHWVQGKLGSSHVSAAVKELLLRAGLTDVQFDANGIQAILDGFVIHERVTARAAIDQLMQAYFFSMRESNGKLKIIPRHRAADLAIEATACVPKTIEEQQVAFVVERKEDLVLPERLEVQFLNRLQRYETSVQSAARMVQEATDTVTVGLSLVLSQAHARSIADTLLTDRWAERSAITFQLPIAYAAIEPGDLLQLNDGGLSYKLRVKKVQIGKPGIVRISGVVDASEVNDFYASPVVGNDGSAITPPSATHLEILEIPALPGDAQDAMTVRFAACGVSENWSGATLIRLQPASDDQVLLNLSKAATIGKALNALPAGPTSVLDETNILDISFLGEASMGNITELTLLNSGNTAVLGEEIIQFAKVEALGSGVYRLSNLLRGRLGTEDKVTGHAIGDRFVMLNDAVVPYVFPMSNLGQALNVRASSFGTSLSMGETYNHAIGGTSLKPYPPVQVNAIKAAGGDITISWKRRARIDGGLRDYIDIPLKESTEQYDVKLYDGSVIKRTWRVLSPAVTYSSAEQIADFGAVPSSLNLAVAQLSALVGPGNFVQTIVPVEQ